MQFPVFPLNGAILFPGTNLPLNIFEERYVQMVDYALSNNRLIGMIQSKENSDFFNIGCLGKITNFTEMPDGKYQINLEGLDRFMFSKIIKTKYKFITIEANLIKLNKNLNTNSIALGKKLLLGFKNFLKEKKISFNITEFEGLNTTNLAKIICVIAPMDYLVKQMLLEFDNEEEFCLSLLSVLEIEMKNNENNKRVN